MAVAQTESTPVDWEPIPVEPDVREDFESTGKIQVETAQKRTGRSTPQSAVQKVKTEGEQFVKIASGIPALDESIGGLPDRSLILLLGDPDSGGNVCAQQIFHHGLSEGRPGIYFTCNKSPRDILDDMKVYGWDLQSYIQRGQVNFIDTLSTRTGQQPGKVSWDIGPANKLAKEFPPLVKKLGQVTFVLDSLTDLKGSTAFQNVEAVIKNLQYTVRALGGVYLLMAVRGVHTEQELNALRHLSDGVIEFSTEAFGSEEFTRRLKVSKMPWSIPETKMYSFRLGPTGIEMVALHRIK